MKSAIRDARLACGFGAFLNAFLIVDAATQPPSSVRLAVVVGAASMGLAFWGLVKAGDSKSGAALRLAALSFLGSGATMALIAFGRENASLNTGISVVGLLLVSALFVKLARVQLDREEIGEALS